MPASDGKTLEESDALAFMQKTASRRASLAAISSATPDAPPPHRASSGAVRFSASEAIGEDASRQAINEEFEGILTKWEEKQRGRTCSIKAAVAGSHESSAPAFNMLPSAQPAQAIPLLHRAADEQQTSQEVPLAIPIPEMEPNETPAQVPLKMAAELVACPMIDAE